MEHIAMRSWHSHIRDKLSQEVDDQTREKLWAMNYLSGLSLETQTITVPSNFLLPHLKPVNLVRESSVFQTDKCKDVGGEVNDPYCEQSLPSSHPALQIEQGKDDVKDSH